MLAKPMRTVANAHVTDSPVGWDPRACDSPAHRSRRLVGRRSQARWSHPTRHAMPPLRGEPRLYLVGGDLGPRHPGRRDCRLGRDQPLGAAERGRRAATWPGRNSWPTAKWPKSSPKPRRLPPSTRCPSTPATSRSIPPSPAGCIPISQETTDETGLISVRVTVTRDMPEGQHPIKFSVVRWVPDPSYTYTPPTSDTTSTPSGS